MTSKAVYVEIEPGPEGATLRTTYLEKHGLFLHWDGHGKLLGVEVRGDNLVVKEFDEIGM